MRDTRKPKEYFDKRIAYEIARIEKFSTLLASLDASNEEGKNNGKMVLGRFNKNLFKLSYSAGESIDDIFHYYLKYLNYYKEICSPYDSTYDMVDLLSIGVLYEDKKEQFLDDLRIIVNRFDSKDGIIHHLMNYLENKPIQVLPSKIKYYNALATAENKKEVLIKELRVWYRRHSGAYWYDSHKSKEDTYCGYWCFEVAAFVKIFNIDDSEFADNVYYPYDLLHQKS